MLHSLERLGYSSIFPSYIRICGLFEVKSSKFIMVGCSVVQCHTNQKNNPENHSFHRFPSDPVMKTRWMLLIGRIGWKPKKNSFVCSKHFLKKYVIKRQSYTVLSKEAIPTLRVPAPVDPTSPIKLEELETEVPTGKEDVQSILERLEAAEQLVRKLTWKNEGLETQVKVVEKRCAMLEGEVAAWKKVVNNQYRLLRKKQRKRTSKAKKPNDKPDSSTFPSNIVPQNPALPSSQYVLVGTDLTLGDDPGSSQGKPGCIIKLRRPESPEDMNKSDDEFIGGEEKHFECPVLYEKSHNKVFKKGLVLLTNVEEKIECCDDSSDEAANSALFNLHDIISSDKTVISSDKMKEVPSSNEAATSSNLHLLDELEIKVEHITVEGNEFVDSEIDKGTLKEASVNDKFDDQNTQNVASVCDRIIPKFEAVVIKTENDMN